MIERDSFDAIAGARDERDLRAASREFTNQIKTEPRSAARDRHAQIGEAMRLHDVCRVHALLLVMDG